MKTEQAILDMYCARVQQLAEEYAPRVTQEVPGGLLATNYNLPGYREAKAIDKQYRRAMLDMGAINTRMAVELGWHFERTLRREARALVTDEFKQRTAALSEAMARAWQQV